MSFLIFTILIISLLSPNQAAALENRDINNSPGEFIFHKQEQQNPILLEKNKIFEKFMERQRTQKRFCVKVRLVVGIEGATDWLSPYTLTEHLLDVDLEQKVLYSKRERKSPSPLDDAYKKRPYAEDVFKREFYLLDQMLYFKYGGRWHKYPRFNKDAPTFWKMMGLIRIGGFYNEEMTAGLKPSVDEIVCYAMGFSDHIDDYFGSAFGIFFLSLNYADILDIEEGDLDNITCYKFKTIVPESDVRKLLEKDFAIFTDETCGPAITPSRLAIEVFISKDDFSLIAARIDNYKTKGWIQNFTKNEKIDFSVDEKIIFEYPKIPLEVSADIKNAEIEE